MQLLSDLILKSVFAKILQRRQIALKRLSALRFTLFNNHWNALELSHSLWFAMTQTDVLKTSWSIIQDILLWMKRELDQN